MKPDLKFLTAFTLLAWFYLMCVVVYNILNFSYIDTEKGNPNALNPLKETIFLILLMYLAYILLYYKERRIIIISFYFYGATVLVSLCSSFITDQYKISNYLEIIGLAIIVSFINFAIQVFKTHNPRLKKPYKNFALALIIYLSAKAAVGLYTVSKGAFDILSYRKITACINLTELLIPVAVIGIFNAIKALQENPEDNSGPNTVYV